MSVRALAIAIPAALIGLGILAASASASTSGPTAAAAHTVAWNVQKERVGNYGTHRQSATKRKSRFSGFGFRGDGFRNSGKYQ